MHVSVCIYLYGTRMQMSVESRRGRQIPLALELQVPDVDAGDGLRSCGRAGSTLYC